MKTSDQVLRPGTNPPPFQTRFEEDRVEMLLRAFNLTEAKWSLLDAHKHEYGTRRLTLAGFRRMFPTFPLALDARYEGGVGERLTIRDLFRRFRLTFLCDVYTEAFARLGEEAGHRPVGLVLPF